MIEKLRELLNSVLAAIRGSSNRGSGRSGRGGRTGPQGSVQPDQARVITFLDEQNGAAWQSEIKAELEWSASKTSRVLSTLEDEDHIARYRVGREKVVCLPGAEPEWLDDVWMDGQDT